MKGKDDFFTFALVVLFILMIFPLAGVGSLEDVRRAVRFQIDGIGLI